VNVTIARTMSVGHQAIVCMRRFAVPVLRRG
jgi:hypothetical protein